MERRKLDICILTARTKELFYVRSELEQVGKSITRSIVQAERRDGIDRFEISAEAGLIRVGVTHCGRMGNVQSAAMTGYLISRYSPALIILVGIAGSLNEDAAKLGDVVIPGEIICREFNRVTEITKADVGHLDAGKRKELFFDESCLLESDIETISLKPAAASFASKLMGKSYDDLLSTLEGRKTKIVHEDSGFSWNKVLDSELYRNYLPNYINRAPIIVDMESYGFLKTIDTLFDTHECHGIIVRGVSDYCRGKRKQDAAKSGLAKDVARQNAAKVAVRACVDAYPKFFM